MMKFWKYTSCLAAMASLLVGFASCGSDDDDDLGKKPVIDPVLPVVTNKYTAKTEVPVVNGGNLFIQHSTKVGNDSVMTYCLEYNTEANHSSWVAFRFDAITRVKGSGVNRSPDFMEDPDLPTSYQHGTQSFSGYDRGHLCASYDRYYTQEANNQTFYMTNMSPQMESFNQEYWVKFEQKVQDWGRSASFADTLFVVKGGTIGAGQTLRKVVHNGKEVAVPRYYFMALLKCKNNQYEALGFWMEHKDYGMKKEEVTDAVLASRIVSIDELEEKTGFDFFHNLPNVTENRVEQEVNPASWGL